MIGEIVGSYRIVSKISAGGMGTVYKAEHTIISKLAAVKVLLPQLSNDEEIARRFLKEAQATTTIKHPGIVDVLDFGYMESGEAYLVMEFLEGMSLAKRLKLRGTTTEGEAAMLLRYVCTALAAAHGKGIVHRDLKPDNIFMVPDPESPIGERPKLLDFGIAKLTEVGLAGSATKTGLVMGTPTYMSPEQCRGTGEIDHRADLYSIGCVYYEMITGRPPFEAAGAGELIGAHLFVEPERPSVHRPDVSPESEALILALLQKRPERRPQSARELGQRLTLIAEEHGWITVSSPTGVTATSLPELHHTGELPSKPPGATTPASTPAPLFIATPDEHAEVAEKPTTLSGAASALMDVPRRSRRTLGIVAFVAAMAVGGGTVAIVKSAGGSDDAAEASGKSSTPASSTSPTTAAGPTTTSPPSGPTSTSPPSAAGDSSKVANPAVSAPTTAGDTPAAATDTAVAKPATDTAIAKPATDTRPATGTTKAPKPEVVAKKKPARPPVKTDPKRPKKPTLIETDL